MKLKFMEFNLIKLNKDGEGFDDAYIDCYCYGNRDGEEFDPKTVHGDGEGFVNTGCVYCGNDHEEFL